MKRICLWSAALLAVCLLCGCQERGNPNVYDVIYNEQTYTVDQEQKTVAFDGEIYRFEVSNRGGNSVQLDITYPDGSRYHWTQEANLGTGGWSDDYDPKGKGYVPGDVLWEVLGLRQAASRGSADPVLFLAPLLLIAGAFLVITPRGAWLLGGGWRFRDADPSDAALGFNRALGGVLIFIGAVGVLASLSI